MGKKGEEREGNGSRREREGKGEKKEGKWKRMGRWGRKSKFIHPWGDGEGVGGINMPYLEA